MNQTILEKFDEIYDTTYKNTSKYILLHCNNLDNVNDLIQDTYLEFYKYLSRKKLDNIEDIDKYIIGIAKNILKKYYHKDCNIVSIYQGGDSNEILDDLDINLELDFITKENVNEIWNYIKSKNIIISKIFFCFYNLDMKISEIALEMQLNESTVKNYIYRTIRELQQIFKKEDYKNV